MYFGSLLGPGNHLKSLLEAVASISPNMSPYTTMATQNKSKFIHFHALFSWPARRATTRRHGNISKCQAPVPTCSGIKYLVRGNPSLRFSPEVMKSNFS